MGRALTGRPHDFWLMLFTASCPFLFTWELSAASKRSGELAECQPSSLQLLGISTVLPVESQSPSLMSAIPPWACLCGLHGPQYKCDSCLSFCSAWMKTTNRETRSGAESPWGKRGNAKQTSPMKSSGSSCFFKTYLLFK